ncbi:uncharacterized protein YlbG (UPF0298 family) [Melghiribacillus thermohalophilus]|uniref:UPF0298 protein EDD68_101252 n=1 Tax=Melghiribacillus thermohalophilus TaxID=1324956 RepID=A0A4R3NE26_9BACI|nr:DUF2129 domain-containing protein [Melghiribacillus thermohalophilus]TCT26895.1 uncharacterized protein YlbG (UPF0298 family) [Melghiribacillus thermohalophilus]
MWTKRQGLIVWLRHLKYLRKIRRYGHIIYSSKKLKYVVMYVNQDEAESLAEKLQSLPFVTRVEPSYKPYVNQNYKNSRPDQAKEYDYKYGFFHS